MKLNRSAVPLPPATKRPVRRLPRQNRALTVSFAPASATSTTSTSSLRNPDFNPDGRDLAKQHHDRLGPAAPAPLGPARLILPQPPAAATSSPTRPRPRRCKPCHATGWPRTKPHPPPRGEPRQRCVSCHMPATEFARLRSAITPCCRPPGATWPPARPTPSPSASRQGRGLGRRAVRAGTPTTTSPGLARAELSPPPGAATGRALGQADCGRDAKATPFMPPPPAPAAALCRRAQVRR